MINYSGSIIETYDNDMQAVIDSNDCIYLSISNKLFLLDKNELNLFFEFSYPFDISFLNGDCWIHNCKDVFSDTEESVLFDIHSKVFMNLKINEWINTSTQVNGDVLVDVSIRWENRYLYSFNKKTKSQKKVKGEFSLVKLNSEFIYVREDEKGLFCFDKDLNEVWKQDLGGVSYSKANETPQFNEDLVIINHSNTILAFNKNSGDAIWRHELSESPGCFSVANDKVYLTERLSILILNALTGRVITKEHSGYDEKVLSEFETDAQVGVFPVDDYLYVFSRYHSTIKFLSSDAKECIQVLEIEHVGYNTGDITPPIIYNNQIYQDVYNRNAKSGVGLLILSPSEETANVIKKQPRLPTRIYAVPSLDVVHTQRVYIEGDKIHDICRFSGIAINELYYETGTTPVFPEKKCSHDKKHNGVIELVVDVKLIKHNEKAEFELNSLVDTLNESFNDVPAYCGSGKNPITVNLILQDREYWDEKGDLIDVDKIRKAHIPIS